MSVQKVDQTQIGPDNVTAKEGTYNINPNRDVHKTFTNKGATGQVTFNLPNAASGLRYEFYCAETVGVKIVAQTGHTIRIEGNESGSGGYAESITIGSFLTLKALSSTEWIAEINTGTWSVT